MNIDGSEFYEVSGKLTQGTWERTLKTIKPNSATEALEFEEASKTSAFFSSGGLSIGVNTKCQAVHDGEKTLLSIPTKAETITPGRAFSGPVFR